MFYDTFVFLCKQKGLSPSKAAIEAHISKSLVTKWKTNGTEVPSPEVLKKLSVFFNVTPDYLLGYDIQSQIDTLSEQISQLKKEIRVASASRKEELEAAIFMLEESMEDLVFSKACLEREKDKKNPPSEIDLTEGDVELLKAFHAKPLAEQRALLTLLGLSED